MWLSAEVFLGSLIVLVVKVLWLLLLITLTSAIFMYLKKYLTKSGTVQLEKYQMNKNSSTLFRDICGFCGTSLKPQYKFCPKCGTETEIGITNGIGTTLEDKTVGTAVEDLDEHVQIKEEEHVQAEEVGHVHAQKVDESSKNHVAAESNVKNKTIKNAGRASKTRKGE